MACVQNIEMDARKFVCLIDLQGHPTECLTLAHSILGLVLGQTRRWHIMHIEGYVLEDYSMPSDFRMRVQGQAFD